MLNKALEWASVSIGAPLVGNMDGYSSLKASEIKRYIIRYVGRYLHRGPVGEPGGDSLAGSF